MATDYDYIIVGAGSAGCVLANRLSADPGTSVLLLEAGGKDTDPWIHIPAGFIKTFYHPKVNWLYSMEPTEWTGGRGALSTGWPRMPCVVRNHWSDPRNLTTCAVLPFGTSNTTGCE